MKRTLVHFLVVGVPGLCFLIIGAVNHERLIAFLGGALVIVFVYGVSRKGIRTAPTGDPRTSRLSFIVAGIIGVSLAVKGFAGPSYWVAAVGLVLVIGSLLQLYRTMVDGRR